MKTILIRLLVTAFTLILVAEFVPGVEVASPLTALIAAFVIGIVNTLIRPILLFVTFPITLLSLGLFVFVLNAGLFWGVASFIDGFTVHGFIPALIGSIVLSIVGTIVNREEND